MRWALAGAVIAAVVSYAEMANAAVTVFGDTAASACSKLAKEESRTLTAVEVCTAALDGEMLGPRDMAATYINRGALRLNRQEWALAEADFDAAVRVDPRLGDARVNRGAAYIAQHRLEAGVAEIDEGLRMGSEEPEKGWYNRGLAHEFMDDLKAAYLDYRKAAELAPKWPLAKEALARFTVTRR